MLHIVNSSEFKLYLKDEHFETIASKIGAILKKQNKTKQTKPKQKTKTEPLFTSFFST